MDKMKAEDFMNLPTVDLMGWWIADQTTSTGQIDSPQDHADRYAKIIAAYEAYGREGVSLILGEVEYDKPEDHPKVISLAKAKEFLTKMRTGNDHRIFSVEFVKRTDGSVRHMKCMYGVKKHLKGGEKAFDDKDHDLTTVFDVEAEPRHNIRQLIDAIEGLTELRKTKGDYRSISLEAIIRLTIGGRRYIIEENKDKVNLLKD